MLDKQLRQQREWKRYKEELLAEASLQARPPTRLMEVMGPRRYAGEAPSARARNAAAAAGEAGKVPVVTPPLSPRGKNRPGSGKNSKNGRPSVSKQLSSLLDGLHNGAASAELAAASSDMGTTITEQFTQTNGIEPSKPKAKKDAVMPESPKTASLTMDSIADTLVPGLALLKMKRGTMGKGLFAREATAGVLPGFEAQAPAQAPAPVGAGGVRFVGPPLSDKE